MNNYLKLAFFNRTQEIFIIVFTIIFLFLSSSDSIFHFYPFTSSQTELVIKVFLLDAAHVAISLSFLFFLPEFNQWSKTVKFKKASVFLTMAGVFSLVFLILYYIYWGNGFLNNLFLPTVEYFQYLLLLIALYHGFYQFRGILTAYNFKCLKEIPKTDIGSINKWEKYVNIEKKLFHFILIVFAFYHFKIYTSNSNVSLTLTNFFIWPTLTKISFYILIALIVTQIIVSSYIPYTKKTLKLFFQLRFFLIVFIPLSDFSIISLSGMHAIEYFFIYKTILNKSKISLLNKKQLYLYSFITIIILNIFASPWWLQSESEKVPLLYLMTTIYTSLSFIHFFLDRYIFRMRDPNTRKIIGPLYS
jgi:hypothetical protein